MIPLRKMNYFEDWCFSEIFIPFYTFSANGSYPQGDFALFIDEYGMDNSMGDCNNLVFEFIVENDLRENFRKYLEELGKDMEEEMEEDNSGIVDSKYYDK